MYRDFRFAGATRARWLLSAVLMAAYLAMIQFVVGASGPHSPAWRLLAVLSLLLPAVHVLAQRRARRRYR